MKDIAELEEKIGYKFQNKELLLTALTHSSYANENKGKSYERLEFLGDSILGLLTTEYLFRDFPDLPEGQLTKTRASLVCESSLCLFSKSMDIGKYMRLSNGEMRSGGDSRPSILADMFESVIAALFLDSSATGKDPMEICREFVLRFIAPAAKTAGKRRFKDYKTALQEIIQQNPEEKLSYAVVSETGPDHSKHFQVEVHLNSNVVGKGGGKSKKEAEQQAAQVALKLLGY